MGQRKFDLTGQIFGKLTALDYLPGKDRDSKWRCKCECGNECVVNTTSLRNGHTKSCGCAKVDACVSRARNIIDRLWGLSTTIPFSGCWIYLGHTRLGYGRIQITNSNGKIETRMVHRLAYLELVGEIPDGMELDHKCRVRCCWNPDHLEPVTPRINTLRGIGISAQNHRKTHCSRGHPYDEKNTRILRRKRYCRACDKIKYQIYKKNIKGGNK